MNRINAARKALITSLSLAGLIAACTPAGAAWNNVFQVTCNTCQTRTNTSYYSPAPAPVAAAPATIPSNTQQCNTSYVQRSYYEPVTSYERKSYYEQVTTNHTSYYYEPVTTTRTSYYYDPCSCSYKPQCSKETSYSLKAQQCPQTNYVERTYLQPVTSYRQAYYYQPVTQCCTTTMGDPVAAPGGAPISVPGAVAPAAAPMTISPAPAPVGMPGSTNQPLLAPVTPAPATPGVVEQRTPGVSYNPSAAPMNPAPLSPVRPSAVRPDRLTSIPGASASPVRGQVLSLNTQPLSNAQVTFVPMEQSGTNLVAQTDSFGRFQADLPSGVYQVYLRGGQNDAKAQLAQTVRLSGNNDMLRLVSR